MATRTIPRAPQDKIPRGERKVVIHIRHSVPLANKEDEIKPGRNVKSCSKNRAAAQHLSQPWALLLAASTAGLHSSVLLPHITQCWGSDLHDVKQPKAKFQPRSKEFHSAFHLKHAAFLGYWSCRECPTQIPLFTTLLLFNTMKLQLDWKRCWTPAFPRNLTEWWARPLLQAHPMLLSQTCLSTYALQTSL